MVDLDRRIDAMSAELTTFADKIEAQNQSDSHALATATASAEWTVAILGLVAVVGGVLAAMWLTSTRIVAPIARLSSQMNSMSGGWLHTGDVAVKDPDGFYRIVDRKKDMIVTGGFNVFPSEIENVITQHPAVAQVSVFGVPDEKWGEAVTAAVVLRPGATVEPDILSALVKEHKGYVQAPKRVVFIDAIPQTAVGKPDKKALRATFGQS